MVIVLRFSVYLKNSKEPLPSCFHRIHIGLRKVIGRERLTRVRPVTNQHTQYLSTSSRGIPVMLAPLGVDGDFVWGGRV